MGMRVRAAADTVAAEHSDELTSDLDAFASLGKTTNEATSASMNRTLEDAVSRVESMEEGAKAFAAQTQATSQRDQAAAASAVEAISTQSEGVITAVTKATSELGAESEAAVTGLEAAVEAVRESTAAATLDVEGVAQTAADLPGLVAGVTEQRVASLDSAAATVRGATEQGKAAVESQIEREGERQSAWDAEHVETVATLETTLRAHVEDAAVALAKTNETPVKQVTLDPDRGPN